MEKAPTSFADGKKMIQRIYVAVCFFFCVVIVSLYTFAWEKGASLESVVVSVSFLCFLIISSCGLLYLLSIRIAKKYVDNESVLEVQSSRQNYKLHLLLFGFLACNILGLIMIFAKKMFLLGFLFVFISAVLSVTWYKLLHSKKGSTHS